MSQASQVDQCWLWSTIGAVPDYERLSAVKKLYKLRDFNCIFTLWQNVHNAHVLCRNIIYDLNRRAVDPCCDDERHHQRMFLLFHFRRDRDCGLNDGNPGSQRSEFMQANPSTAVGIS